MTGRADIIRPKWHFALKKGWLNDPNGLVWFKGEYHLYFQCNPYGNEWAMMHNQHCGLRGVRGSSAPGKGV